MARISSCEQSRFALRPQFIERMAAEFQRSKYRNLRRVMFHALRHSHASGLIASGLDILDPSAIAWGMDRRRVGYQSGANFW